MKVITAHSISKRYGAEEILRDISFSLRRGDSLLINGGNGSGKTTLSLICAKLIEPDAGTVFVNGKIAAVCDKINPYRELTALENIAFCGGVTDERIISYADKLNFTPYLKKRGEVYSSGTWQKLKLLISLSVSPSLLILDELFPYLDAHSALAAASILGTEKKNFAMILSGNGKYERKLAHRKINIG